MEDMQSVDSLREAIDGFCSVHADASREEYAKHLNVILVQVATGSGLDLSKLVTQHLGAFLTHHDSNVRMRSVLLLAELLQRLPDLPINAKSGASLCGFFAERLESDYDSAIPCFLALKSLLKTRPSVFKEQPTVVEKILKSALTAHHIPSMAQSFRYGAYELVSVLLDEETYFPLLRRQGFDFVQQFVNAMDGEKDPRCLLLCLRVSTKLLLLFDDDVVKQAAKPMFEVTCVYFPITFRPPPNDPYGITTESLVEGLTEVFCATPYMAEHVIPMTLDKLALTKQEVSLAKLDSFKLLSTCFPRYGVAATEPYLLQLRNDVYRHVVNAEDAEVADAAVGLIGTIAKEIAKEYEAGEYTVDKGPWGTFIGGLVELCAEQIDASIDSMLSKGSARIIAAIAASSGLGLRHCTLQFQARIERWLREDASLSQRNAALDLLLSILQGINVDVDFAAGANPLDGLAKGLFDVLTAQLTQDVDRSLAVRGIEVLMCKPPSPLLHDNDMGSAVRALTKCMGDAEVKGTGGEGKEADVGLRSECLEALGRCGQASKVAGNAVMDETVGVLLQRLQDGQDTWALEAVVELCKVPQVFAKTVPALMKVIVVSGGFVSDEDKLVSVLRALDEMVKRNKGDTKAMSGCLVSNSSTPDKSGQQSVALVPELIQSLLHSEALADIGRRSDISDRCSSIVRNAVQSGDDNAQSAMAKLAVDIVLSNGSDATKMRKMLPVVTAVLGSLRILNQTDLKQGWADEVCRLQCKLILQEYATVGELGVVCASQLMASLLNKLDDTDMNALRDEIVKGDVNGGEGLLDVVCGNGDKLKRIAALECASWVFKGLSMRGDAFAEELGNALLTLLKDRNEDADLRRRAALAFGLAVKECEEVLNAQSFGKKMFLFEQRFFKKNFAALKDALSTSLGETSGHDHSHSHGACHGHSHGESGETAKGRDDLLFALVQLVEHAPKAVVFSELDEILLLLVDALGATRIEIQASAVASFVLVIEQDVESTAPHLAKVIPVLLELTVYKAGSKAESRIKALSCLMSIAKQLPYHKVHPYKPFVCRKLQPALDDRKRVVRKQAVTCRNLWLTLQAGV